MPEPAPEEYPEPVVAAEVVPEEEKSPDKVEVAVQTDFSQL